VGQSFQTCPDLALDCQEHRGHVADGVVALPRRAPVRRAPVRDNPHPEHTFLGHGQPVRRDLTDDHVVRPYQAPVDEVFRPLDASDLFVTDGRQREGAAQGQDAGQGLERRDHGSQRCLRIRGAPAVQARPADLGAERIPPPCRPVPRRDGVHVCRKQDLRPARPDPRHDVRLAGLVGQNLEVDAGLTQPRGHEVGNFTGIAGGVGTLGADQRREKPDDVGAPFLDLLNQRLGHHHVDRKRRTGNREP
jgi:hypothetical protein